MPSKILLFDIENAPSSAYIWSLYQEVVSEDMLGVPWYILCWSAKWLGSKEVMSSALIDFPSEYKKNPENDKLALKKLWALLDEADIVIAHNGKQFDVRKINARFIMNGMPPPSPYKVVDTLLAARQYFFFTSNKLTDLGKYLKCGEKMETGGFKLWRDCMAGNKKAWRKLVKYCRNDILLLEKIYLKLRPYILNHPATNIYGAGENGACPRCGSKSATRQGFSYTATAKYQRFRCNKCYGWFRTTGNCKDKSIVETRNV